MEPPELRQEDLAGACDGEEVARQSGEQNSWELSADVPGPCSHWLAHRLHWHICFLLFFAWCERVLCDPTYGPQEITGRKLHGAEHCLRSVIP